MNNIPWAFVKIYFMFLRVYQIIHHFFIPFIKKKHEQKIFCIGYDKTGTVSLYKALSILGYRSIHFLRLDKEPKMGWVEYIKKCKYDAYSDSPMTLPEFFKKLDKAFPNSKFILTIRESNSFIHSYKNYYEDSPWEIKDDEDYNLRLHIFEEHNRLVKDYFKNRSSDLLIMNIIEGDGWSKLCNFLEKPIPKKSFPYLNISRKKK